MIIKDYIQALRKRSVSVLSNNNQFAIVFINNYFIDIYGNNMIYIRHITNNLNFSIKFIEQQFVKIKYATEPCIVNNELNPKYFPKTELLKTFNISQYKGKDVDTMLTELEISKYENDLKPILSIMLEALP